MGWAEQTLRAERRLRTWEEPVEDWQRQAACQDVPLQAIEALFFPTDGQPVSERTRQLCESCPVAEACQTFAMANRYADGVWGGVDMRQVHGRTVPKVA